MNRKFFFRLLISIIAGISVIIVLMVLVYNRQPAYWYHYALSFILGGIVVILVWNSWLLIQSSREARNSRTVNELPESKSTVRLVITASLCVALLSWLFWYFAQNNPRTIPAPFRELALSIFGLSAATVVVQIVFERILRRQILEQTTKTLSEIMLLRPEVAKSLFSHEKRNEIIRLYMQIQTEEHSPAMSLLNSDTESYGIGLYESIKPYLEGTFKRKPRKDFRNDITFCPVDDNEISCEYYLVKEHIRYVSYLPGSVIKVGCAYSDESLYELFSDPMCIYRWLVSSSYNDFQNLMAENKRENRFRVKLKIDGQECVVRNIEHPITAERGYEIVFDNPLMDHNLEKEVEFDLEVSVLHPKSKHFFSVHLAYPVNVAHIQFIINDESMENIDVIHFFTHRKPYIYRDVNRDGRVTRIVVDVEGQRLGSRSWTFPEAGIVFAWEQNSL